MSKVAIVIQRYGPEIVGGAESLCRLIAERLVAQLGWSVTVYTSEALDYNTWKNELHRADEVINGVKIKRFKVLFPRIPKVFALANQMLTPLILRLATGKRLSRLLGRLLEYIWLVLQGPYCPSLVRALRVESDSYDKVFFFTYLYYPTIFGAKALKNKKFALIPTAHQEAPFYFQHVRRLLLSCSRVLVNIAPEKTLIDARMGFHLPSIRIAGLGFDIPPSISGEAVPFEGPYILYLGRICGAKGVDFLNSAFLAFKHSKPQSKLKLVLVGKMDQDFKIPDSESIQYLGFVDEHKKFELIKHSLCVVNPSQYESLSMIAIEAMVCEKPLLLNKASEVLAYYCQETTTCFGYHSKDEFIQQLAVIENKDWNDIDLQAKLNSSRTWAEANYSWACVLNAYSESPNLQYAKVNKPANQEIQTMLNRSN